MQLHHLLRMCGAASEGPQRRNGTNVPPKQPSKSATPGYHNSVFINCPFDDGYKQLFQATVFTVLYWDVRLLAMRDILAWYPIAPWV